MSKYFTKRLENLEPYTPGEQPRDRAYIKLNANENPYPPTPWVAKALNGEAMNGLRLYCDAAGTDLRNAIATRYDVDPACVILGNGSDEVLYFAMRAFCDEGRAAAFADVTYSFYEVWAALMHVPTHVIPLEADFTLDTRKYYGLNGETIFIANPNAPTGLALPRSEIEKVIAANQGGVVIVDEAYVDFGGESCVPLTKKYKNLLVTQTFSKSRCLAGARLGFAIGDAALIADLNRVKFSLNPYNINSMTLLAGEMAMKDEDYFRETCGSVIAAREDSAKALAARGFEVLPSKTNFLFARTPKMPGAALQKALKEKGLLVRHFDAPRLSDWLRITVGTPENMQALMQAIDEVLAADQATAE